MKRYSILLLTLAVALATIGSSHHASAQMRAAYFMDGSTQRYDLNAALTPTRGYFSVPVVNITSALESNFLAADNFFYPDKQNNQLVSFMHSSVSADEFLAKLPDMNTATIALNDRIIGVGNYFKAGFWSLGLSLRSETNVNIPKHFFELIKTLRVGDYTLDGMGIESTNFLEAALGYSFPVQDVFTLGLRAKVLVGLAHARATFDQMNIKVSGEEYRAEMSGSVEANIVGYNFDQLQGEVAFSQMIDHVGNAAANFGTANIASIGFAFDAGIEWSLLYDQLRLSAAVNDLGYNAWGLHNSFNASVSNVAYAFQGFDVQNQDIFFEAPENIVMNRTEVEEGYGKFPLTANYIVGAEYDILGDYVTIGAMWQGKQYNEQTKSAITAALILNPVHWLTATVSESFVKGGANVFGAALNFHNSGINLFVGMDYLTFNYGTAKGGKLPVPISQNSANITFGLSVPLSPKDY